MDQTCGAILFSSTHDKRNLLSIYRNWRFTPPEASDDEPDKFAHFDLVRARAIPFADLPPNRPAQSIFPTPISTTYINICTTLSCPSAYPSETATTVTALVTRISPESVPAVPMRSKSVAHTSTGDAGKAIAVQTTMMVPDEKGIKELEEAVRVWREDWEEGNAGWNDGREAAL